MKVAAIVVTFNRLKLLQGCITSLRNQTRKIDEIIVINNSSIDGTLNWLNEQKDLSIITQENNGSAGGQYTGIKTAYEKGYDWIWCMDDDIELEKDCLEKLLLIADREFKNDYFVYLPDRKIPGSNKTWRYGINFNFKNPFKRESTKTISANDFSEDFAQIKSITFEGPLFHNTVVQKIGNVNRDLFIFYDDTEYSIRMDINNIKIALVKDALLYRKNQNINKGVGLKDYYLIRNSIFLDKSFGNKFFMSLRLVSTLFRYSKALIRSVIKGDAKNIRYIFYGIMDGYKNKLGKFSK